jgi:hypothetical protein
MCLFPELSAIVDVCLTRPIKVSKSGGIPMAETGGKTAGSGSKSGGKSASTSAASKSSSGKQGGSHDQHAKAGEQSHKGSK